MEEVTQGQPVAAQAPTTGAPSQAADTAATPAAFDWNSQGLDNDTLGYVHNKGWAKPADVLQGYRNLEKLMGAGPDKLVRLPGEGDTTSWGQVWDKLGRPAKAEDYKIAMPEGVQDDATVSFLRNTFHEIGVTGKQAEAFTAKMQEQLKSNIENQINTRRETWAAQEVELKNEWGSKFDQNFDMARRAVREFKLDVDVIDKLQDAMGYDGVMKLMHTFGSKLGESRYVDGGQPQGFGASKEGALNEINRLRNDSEFGKKLVAGDAEARTKWDRLHTIAFAG